MKTTHTPSSNCLNCGYLLDAATDPISNAAPRPGDISLCLKCGHVMVFTEDLKVRNLTGSEVVEIAGSKHLLVLMKARQAAFEEMTRKEQEEIVTPPTKEV